MARCLRAAGVVRHLAVAEENAAEAALVDSLAVIGVSFAAALCRAAQASLDGRQLPNSNDVRPAMPAKDLTENHPLLVSRYIRE